MNAPAVVAVVLLALALVVVGFVVTLVVVGNAPPNRWRASDDDENVGPWVEVGT